MTDTPATLTPPPPGSPPPVPPATPQAPSPGAPRGKAGLIGIAVAVVLVLACCCVVSGAALLATCSSGSGIAEQDWTLSPDQRAVLRDFGPPQTFAVIYSAAPADPGSSAVPAGGDLSRFETWEYYDAGSQWFFDDGALIDRKDLPALDGSAAFPSLRPEQFGSGMSLDAVSEVIGVEPDSDLDLSFADIEELTGYGWGGQVVAVLQDDRLVSVKTCPVEKGGK